MRGLFFYNDACRPLLICFGLLMLCSGTLVAQTVVYSYDAAGNRTARQQQMPSPYSTVVVAKQTTGNDLVLTGVRVYPNPTEGPLTVSIDESYVKEKCEASIYDASGKLLYHSRLRSNATNLDVRKYKSGVYILTVRLGDKSANWKIVKQ